MNEVILYSIQEENLGRITNVLSSSMYSYPLSSVIREYMSNAIDSHKVMGKEDTPIDIYLPTLGDATIKFQDYGEGMSDEFIKTQWTSFGVSTKRNDKNQIGRFGLGCKSFAAISDCLTLISIKDGVKRTYCVHKDEKNNLNLLPVAEEKVDEINGTLISIPYDYSIHTNKNITKIVNYWSQFMRVRPRIDGIDCRDKFESLSDKPLKLPEVTSVSFEGQVISQMECKELNASLTLYDSFFPIKSDYSASYSSNCLIIKLRDLPYTVDLIDFGFNLTNEFDYICKLSRWGCGWSSYNKFVIGLDITQVALKEPRESINTENKKSNEYIRKVLTHFNEKLKDIVTSSLFEVYKTNFLKFCILIDSLENIKINYRINNDIYNFLIKNRKEIERLYKIFQLKDSWKGKTSRLQSISYSIENLPRSLDLSKAKVALVDIEIKEDILRKYVKEYLKQNGEIQTLVLFEKDPSTNLCPYSGHYIKLSEIKEQVREIFNYKPQNKKGKDEIIAYILTPNTYNEDSIGVCKFLCPTTIKKDIEEKAYYVELNRGSISPLSIFLSPKDSIKSIVQLLDKPLYFIKTSELNKLGTNFLNLNEFGNTDLYKELVRKRTINHKLHEMITGLNTHPFLEFIFNSATCKRKNIITNVIGESSDPLLSELVEWSSKVLDFCKELSLSKYEVVPIDMNSSLDFYYEFEELKAYLQKVYPLLDIITTLIKDKNKEGFSKYLELSYSDMNNCEIEYINKSKTIIGNLDKRIFGVKNEK